MESHYPAIAIRNKLHTRSQYWAEVYFSTIRLDSKSAVLYFIVNLPLTHGLNPMMRDMQPYLVLIIHLRQQRMKYSHLAGVLQTLRKVILNVITWWKFEIGWTVTPGLGP